MNPAAVSRRIETLNGWQRLWVVFSVLAALVIAGGSAADWPSETERDPRESDQAQSVESPSSQFDPDVFLARTEPNPPSGKPRSLESILVDPNYINANDATKRAIFERWAPMDPSYAAADEPARRAIRQRFGIGGSALNETPTGQDPFAKFAGEADLTPEQKAALERARERLALKRRDTEDRQRQELKERQRSVSAAKARLVGAAVAYWLGLVLGVYALGWTFSWVRRGFRGGG
jgi:hypothetical protein